MLSGQSGQGILGRLSWDCLRWHSCGLTTLLAVLALEAAPGVAQAVPSQSSSESVSVSLLVEDPRGEEAPEEERRFSLGAAIGSLDAATGSLDVATGSAVPEQEDLALESPDSVPIAHAEHAVEAFAEEAEITKEAENAGEAEVENTELETAELETADLETVDLETVEPVSADEAEVVEAAETEELIEEALGDSEDAATEIVVEPLSDRCAALPAEPSDSVPSDSVVSTEANATETSPLSRESEEPVSDATTPEAVAEEVAPEDAVPEDVASEATNREDGVNADAAEEAVASDDQAEPAIASETSEEGEDAVEEIDPEIAAKQAQEKREICQLYRADQLYESGQIAEARAIYQSVKPVFETSEADQIEPLVPVTDPEALSPGGQVYLREAQAGIEQNLETRTLVPLKLLTEAHPEYTPGHVKYADALVAAGQSEQGLDVLNKATALHPNDAEVVKASIALAADQGEWMEASMQARRFAQLNPEHPEAETFAALAQENLKLYQGDVRDRLTANTIANVLTGAVTYGVTGNIWNTLSTIQTTTLMLRGEEGVGNSISKSIQRQIPLVEDEEVVAYVNEMGQKLAKVAGRDEFEYEFFVIMDENLNAFALPGGKIFVNAGAIAKTRSETELAGLLSHELAHAVLSHGFKLVSNGSLLSDISRFVPYAGYAANLVVLDYSRDMEREADELGTRILSAAGYPADGLHNLMQTLGEENQSRRPLFAWMSTHPETEERVSNIRAQIQAEGFERYNLERVERHDRMRERVKVLIDIAKKEAEEERKNRPWWR